MKKIFLILVITLILPFNTAFSFYDDVPEDHQYYSAIKNLYDAGKLPEEALNQFQPDKPLTKAFLYKLILSYAQVPLTEEINLPFQDVPTDADYNQHLQTALSLHLLKSSPKFEPDNVLTKYNTLYSIFTTLGIGINPFINKDKFTFTDISSTSYIAPVAQKAYELGILEPDNGGKFKMAKRVTRGQAAYFLSQLQQESHGIQSQTINITLNPSTDTNSITDAQADILTNEKFATFADIWSAIKDKYYYKEEEGVTGDKLISNAIKGMLSELKDKYTAYEEPQGSSFLDTFSSKYEGIGIIIELVNDQVTIISPFKDSPAAKAGLKANDAIKAVNDVSTDGKTLSEISQMIKGPAGSKVKLIIVRDDTQLEFQVVRDFVLLTTVSSEMKTSPNGKKIAYLELINFGQNSYSEFKKAAEDAVAQNPDGFIIDIRNNPGGFVDVTINILALYTDVSKTAVLFKYVDGSEQKFDTATNGLLKKYKTVVLINEGSASASEIFAGALQDWGQATVIGTKSFGKGSAQELRQYADGTNFKYTISKWFTPNNRDISSGGITPDRTILNEGSTEDLQLEAALGEF